MTPAPYSYRRDPLVPAFDDSDPIIIFDGHCVLCSEGVAWMLVRDPDGRSRFAAIADAIPHALYRHYGLDPQAFDTFMVLADGLPHLRWSGVLAAARALPQPWRTFGHLGRLIPSVLGDPIYDLVQRNRIRWFGRREHCFRLGPGSERRLLTPAAQFPALGCSELSRGSPPRDS